MGNLVSIVCSGNRNYIVPIKVMLKSILVNTSSKIEVFILIYDWREEDINLFEKSFLECEIIFSYIRIQESACLKQFKINEEITIESYFRLFIPDVLPSTIKQVIYLDGDIVVEGDIQELWNIPIEDNAIMAVSEMYSGAHLVSSTYALKTYKELKIPSQNKYFNAGVLKINVEKWRQESISEKIINYLIEYQDKILWHDQDGLNAILWNNWKELPPEWNVMSALFYEKKYKEIELDEEQAKYLMKYPKLIHYTNYDEKPWKEHCNHPLKERFYYYKQLLKTI